MARGVDLIEEIHHNHNPQLKIIANKTSDAGLVKQMEIQNSFQIGSTIRQFSSGFFYALEASESALQNMHGDFNATITGFYDCPPVFRKSLKGDDFSTKILNVSFGLLAGCTFEFLKTLVNENSVMGGLASRFIYVMSKERKERKPKWVPEVKDMSVMREKLIHDLVEINKMQGAYEPTPGFIKLWEDYQHEHSKFLINTDSHRIESIMARKPTNLIKICMILSAADNERRILSEEHWEEGLQMMDDVAKDNSFVVSSAMVANTESQAGLNQLIKQTIAGKGNRIELSKIKSAIIRQGNDVTKVNKTIEFLDQAKQIRLSCTERGIEMVELLVDPYASL